MKKERERNKRRVTMGLIEKERRNKRRTRKKVKGYLKNKNREP